MKPLFLSSLFFLAANARAVTPAGAKPPTATSSERVETLSNGLRFVSQIDRVAPRVGLSLLVRVGAGDETAQNAGWRRLLAGAIARGGPLQKAAAPVLSADDGQILARLAERAGGEAGVSVGDDTIEFWATGDSKRAPQLLQLLTALWKSPRLSDGDIEKSKTNLSNQLDAQDLDLAARTSAALRAQEFLDAKGQPLSYGLNEIGTTDSLARLSNERVRDLGRRVAASPATLSAVGDVDTASLRAIWGGLPKPTLAPAPSPAFAAPKKNAKPVLIVRDLPVPAAWVFVSFPLGRVSSDEAPALRLLSAALSDIAEARLTKRLLKANLVTGVPSALSLSSQFVFRRDGSELLLSAQTSPNRVENVKNAMIEEVNRLKTAPLSSPEFSSARNFARGDWALARQSLRDRAFLVGQSPALGGAPDARWPARLNTLSPAQAQAAAKRTIGNYAVALVMPR